MDTTYIENINKYQFEYFNILNDFFIGVTNQEAKKFCVPENFTFAAQNLGENLKNNKSQLDNANRSYETLEIRLKNLHTQEGVKCFNSAKKLNCFKVNLGGSSRVYESQLKAIRKSILLADLVLVPDPVMPWLETKREYENYQMIHILQAAYFILQLKKFFLDHDSYFPPFLVFPSFEKILEAHDEFTINSSKQLIIDFFSYYSNLSFNSIEDLFSFAKLNDKKFLKIVEDSNLLLAPGDKGNEPLSTSIQKYESMVNKWRSQEYQKVFDSIPDSAKALIAIMERIQPQYHLFENSYEFNSNPLLCIEAHAHYFKLISKMTNHRVFNLEKFDKNSLSSISALMNRRLDFLTNINDEQLKFLRKTKENITFRNKLREFINNLPNTEINNITKVASEVCSYIESLISQHEKQIDALNIKYGAKHKYTALIGGGGLAVSLLPALAPFLGAALPLALTTTGKYVANKLDEISERKILSGSMIGVFATLKQKTMI